MHLPRFRPPSQAMVVACVALAVSLSGAAYAAVALPRNSVGPVQVRNSSLGVAELTAAAKKDLRSARGYARIRVIGLLGSGPYWNMALVGPRRGLISARTPAGGTTCLRPNPAVLSLADVQGDVMTDASGNDTRLYFNGSFGCASNEVTVVQKSNGSGAVTNQAFNIVIP